MMRKNTYVSFHAAFYRTGKEKADWYKGEIRDKIRQGLGEHT